MVADGVGGEFATWFEKWEIASEGFANGEFGSHWESVDALEHH